MIDGKLATIMNSVTKSVLHKVAKVTMAQNLPSSEFVLKFLQPREPFSTNGGQITNCGFASAKPPQIAFNQITNESQNHKVVVLLGDGTQN